MKVRDPSDLVIRIHDDDEGRESEFAAQYFLLSEYIADFFQETSLREVVASVSVGDMVLACMEGDQGKGEGRESKDGQEAQTEIQAAEERDEEPSYARAIVTKVDDQNLSDLWFCDEGEILSSIPASHLVPYSAFADAALRNGVPAAIVSLPPRFIRCRLCAIHFDAGRADTVPIVPYDDSDGEEENEDDNDVITASPAWNPEAISFLRRLIGMRVQLVATVLGVDGSVGSVDPVASKGVEGFESGGLEPSGGMMDVAKWCITLTKEDVNVGDALVDYELAQCEALT